MAYNEAPKKPIYLRRHNSLPPSPKAEDRHQKINVVQNIYIEYNTRLRLPKRIANTSESKEHTTKKMDSRRKLKRNPNKRQLQLTLSCPGFQSYKQLETLSSPITSSPDTPSPSDKNFTLHRYHGYPFEENNNFLRQKVPELPPKTYQANDKNRVNEKRYYENPSRSTAITAQPATSIDYARFIKKHEDESYKNKQSECTCSNDVFCSLGCLHKTKSFISCCTCFWCFNSLCYHCVSKDDIGHDTVQIKEALTCKGSVNKNLKRAAISVSCLPFLPCLTIYPLLNKLVEYCIDKKSSDVVVNVH